MRIFQFGRWRQHIHHRVNGWFVPSIISESSSYTSDGRHDVASSRWRNDVVWRHDAMDDVGWCHLTWDVSRGLTVWPVSRSPFPDIELRDSTDQLLDLCRPVPSPPPALRNTPEISVNSPVRRCVEHLRCVPSLRKPLPGLFDCVYVLHSSAWRLPMTEKRSLFRLLTWRVTFVTAYLAVRSHGPYCVNVDSWERIRCPDRWMRCGLLLIWYEAGSRVVDKVEIPSVSTTSHEREGWWWGRGWYQVEVIWR